MDDDRNLGDAPIRTIMDQVKASKLHKLLAYHSVILQAIQLNYVSNALGKVASTVLSVGRF